MAMTTLRYRKGMRVSNLTCFNTNWYYGREYPFLQKVGNLGMIMKVVNEKAIYGYNVKFDAYNKEIFMRDYDVTKIKRTDETNQKAR